MNSVSGPIEAFSVTFGGVEYLLKVLDALGRAIKAKDAFYVRGYGGSVSGESLSRRDGRSDFANLGPLETRRTWPRRWARIHRYGFCHVHRSERWPRSHI